MMNLLRRFADLPILRHLLLRPRVRHVVASILSLRFLRAASLTTQPVTFVTNDLLRARHRLRSYRLKDGYPVLLVHRRDTEALHELFLTGEYEPPDALRSRLLDPRQIVDVGGNIGMFAHWAARRWPHAHVVSLEPSPENADTFRTWISASGEDIELIEACAMTHAGRAAHVQGTGAGSAFDQVEGDADGVMAVDVFPLLEGADLVKIDIEGGEWPILSDARMGDLHDVTLVMEFHRRGAPYLPAHEAATDLLHEAGFTVGFEDLNYWGHGTLWAWKD